MFAGRPEEGTAVAEMAAAIGEPVVELWAENVETVEVFAEMCTQWNVGPAGVVGLRYEALPVVFDLRGTPPASRPAIAAGVRVMERAALEGFRHG